jgi:phage-related protein
MDDFSRPLYWVGSSKKDLKALPSEVQDVFGYALYLAQVRKKHPQARPLKGFAGAGVLEIVEDFSGNSFRAIYTVTMSDAVYVLHCFQKKSRKGIETPRRDMELIHRRLQHVYLQGRGDKHETN